MRFVERASGRKRLVSLLRCGQERRCGRLGPISSICRALDRGGVRRRSTGLIP